MFFLASFSVWSGGMMFGSLTPVCVCVCVCVCIWLCVHTCGRVRRIADTRSSLSAIRLHPQARAREMHGEDHLRRPRKRPRVRYVQLSFSV